MAKKPITEWTVDDWRRMGADVPSKALLMAREVRLGEADHSPSALYAAATDADEYNHAMREAGYVVPKATARAPAVCEVCGFDFGGNKPRADVSRGRGPVAEPYERLQGETE